MTVWASTSTPRPPEEGDLVRHLDGTVGVVTLASSSTLRAFMTSGDVAVRVSPGCHRVTSGWIFWDCWTLIRSARRVVRLAITMNITMAAEEPRHEGLYHALRDVDWHGAGGNTADAVLAERDAYRVRAALEASGLTGWSEVDITAEYVIGRTRDEQNYDGFGTTELASADAEGWRVVAVRREHLDWQTTRYDRWEAL